MNGIEKIGFLGYLSYLKRILTVEESICLARHQEKSFNFLKPILDNCNFNKNIEHLCSLEEYL